MQRYFISHSSWDNNDSITITGDDVHHIVRVMRMNEGDQIICIDNSSKAAVCSIVDIREDAVVAKVDEWIDEQVELPVEVTIAQGLPKGDKLELILQKSTELGASAFIPFQAKRSVVKWDNKKAEKKLNRFSKIVKEASEQSHRTKIPKINEFLSFQQLVEKSDLYDVKLVAYEEEARSNTARKLSDVLIEVKHNQSILACIGPEGGFTMEEVEILKQKGFWSVRLGPRILRTETAPMYLLASISYHFEELR